MRKLGEETLAIIFRRKTKKLVLNIKKYLWTNGKKFFCLKYQDISVNNEEFLDIKKETCVKYQEITVNNEEFLVKNKETCVKYQETPDNKELLVIVLEISLFPARWKFPPLISNHRPRTIHASWNFSNHQAYTHLPPLGIMGSNRAPSSNSSNITAITYGEVQKGAPQESPPVHTEKYFRNCIKSTRNQIVFTIFRSIWIQTDAVRLDPNQSENG